MNIFRLFLLWIASFVFTSAIDALWHLGIFRSMYSEGMKPIARMSGEKMAFKSFPGLMAQILVVTCIVALVLFKAPNGRIWDAVFIGALAGILAITVYGFTNYSLMKDWNLSLTVLEVIWGPFLGSLSG
ncbi:DUF2177 family protein, partial [Acidobacteriota bacterium]